MDGIELHLPGFELGKIQDVVDDAKQVIPRVLQGAHVMLLACIEFGIVQQLGHAENTVHRRTDFMAHIGQKIALELV